MKRFERLTITALLTLITGIGAFVVVFGAIANRQIDTVGPIAEGLPVAIGAAVAVAGATFAVIRVTRLDRTIPGPLPVNDVMPMPEPHGH